MFVLSYVTHQDIVFLLTVKRGTPAQTNAKNQKTTPINRKQKSMSALRHAKTVSISILMARRVIPAERHVRRRYKRSGVEHHPLPFF